MDTNEAIYFFSENGFVILRELLSEEEIVPISCAVNRIIDGSRTLPEQDIAYEPGSSPRRVRNAFRLTENDPFFLGIAGHPRIICVVEAILGRPVRLYSSQLFAKPPEVGSVVPLHQDMPYWPFEPYEMLSSWIALDDSTVENGCVRFIAGSHKLGMLRHVPSGVPGNSLMVDDGRLAMLPEKMAEVPRGSVVLHHSLTAHRSEPNLSDRPRRGLIMIYMSERVRLTDQGRLKGKADFPVVRSPSDCPTFK